MPFARRFALELAEFDEHAARGGVLAAGEFVVQRFAGSLSVTGAEGIPRSGPVVLASNHPGMADALAVWRLAGRSDLLTLAAERSLLSMLPATLRHLIIIRPGGACALRSSLGHLRQGGALLTFPAGQIEPDPALHSGAVESLADWSGSAAALASRVPGAVVVPAAVRGVLSAKAGRLPLLRLIRGEKERRWAGATLQIISRRLRKTDLRVDFGAPIAAGRRCPDEVMAEVLCAMRQLLAA